MTGAQLGYPQNFKSNAFSQAEIRPLKFAFHGTYVKIQIYTDILDIQQRSYFMLITIVSMYGISNTSHQIRYKVSDILDRYIR